MPEIKDYNWDSVVVDESPILKNPKANITKYFLKHFRKVPHRWALTGTPNPEGDENYFCQLAWLDGSAFGHRSFWSFRPSYMEPPYIGYRWVFIPGAIDHIRREVGRRAFVLRRKDVGLDEYKIYERREFEMPKKLRKAYDEAEENFAFNYDGKAYKTMWKGAQYQWLRQMCGGVINKEMVWDGKLQGALELLQGENAHDQVIVWCNYNAEVFAIYAALKKAGIKCAMMTKDTKPPRRRQLERMFDKGLVRVLVLQQAIVQYGADLKAADTVYYYSTPLGHLARTQTEDRIVTIEKAKKGTPLLYIDFVVKDSVDEDALSLLDTKEVMSDLSLARALATAIRERKKWV